MLLSDEEKAQVPASFETVPAKGLGKDVPAYSFRMQVSPYDCLGCGVCLTVCPANANDKTADALVMTPFEEMKAEQANFDEVAMNDKYLKKDVIPQQERQVHAVCKALLPVLRCLRRLRRDHVHQAGQPAGGRQDVHRQRRWLLLRHFRRRPHPALLQGQLRPRPRLGALPVRGQR